MKRNDLENAKADPYRKCTYICSSITASQMYAFVVFFNVYNEINHFQNQ